MTSDFQQCGILTSVYMKFGFTEIKLFHFQGIFKIEIKSVKRAPIPLYL